MATTELVPQLLAMKAKVEAVGSHHSQTRSLECILAHVVFSVLGSSAMTLPVELGDESGFFIEQIGDTEQIALKVEDRSVHLRGRQLRDLQIEDSQP